MGQGTFTVAHALACPCEPGEDRGDVFEYGGLPVVVVADGGATAASCQPRQHQP